MKEWIDAEVDRQEPALESLVDFRRLFFAADDDVAPAEFHSQWSEVLLHGERHFVVEAFRESAKTQIVLRANLLHALAFPQAGRSYIVVVCATQRTASKKLQEVSREIQVDMKKEAPDISVMVSAITEDSGNALEVRCKNDVTVRIEAYGKGAAIRGLSWGSKRPDLILVDDPQDTEDARSETVTEADWDWFLSDVLFLGKDSRIFLIGNNLGEACIVERVMQNAETLGFDCRRVPVLDEGEPAWPERFPLEHIEREKEMFERAGKADIWWREKMCKSISPDAQRFKKEYFRYFSNELQIDGMNIYTTVDLAISKKGRADRSAIVTVGVNPDGHWFVLDVDVGRYDPTETMDAIFRAVVKWRPLEVGIESVAYQVALQHFLEKEMPRRNLFFTITPLKGEVKKELRIDAIQPRFKIGSVWFRGAAKWLPDIEGELLAFPTGLHDDVIDALAYTDQIAVVPARSATVHADTDFDIFTWKKRR